MRAVILLSGGIDSATTLAIARRDGYACLAVSFDYGQRHRYELEAARKVAASLGVVRHAIISFDMRTIGGSALTDDIAVPKGRDETQMGGDIPVTYVPARNTIFLSFALGFAETEDAFDLFIGANAVDYSGYPDCRPEYLRAFERMANLATRAGVEGAGTFRIHAPLIRMTKADIIRTGVALGVDFGLTHSCYDPTPDGAACGQCDSCTLRIKGFREAGVTDPTRYAEQTG
ncbi:MAG: 7-cyano-7-deazaguanine synthase QueC [candidate division Zixibacteria bacterium]|nr:7-cyano-7-deazaguanine synthase QueC [candidate division Zixibacteria bacterium]